MRILLSPNSTTGGGQPKNPEVSAITQNNAREIGENLSGSFRPHYESDSFFSKIKPDFKVEPGKQFSIGTEGCDINLTIPEVFYQTLPALRRKRVNEATSVSRQHLLVTVNRDRTVTFQDPEAGTSKGTYFDGYNEFEGGAAGYAVFPPREKCKQRRTVTFDLSKPFTAFLPISSRTEKAEAKYKIINDPQQQKIYMETTLVSNSPKLVLYNYGI